MKFSTYVIVEMFVPLLFLYKTVLLVSWFGLLVRVEHFVVQSSEQKEFDFYFMVLALFSGSLGAPLYLVRI